jgi:hypothetical protein
MYSRMEMLALPVSGSGVDVAVGGVYVSSEKILSLPGLVWGVELAMIAVSLVWMSVVLAVIWL